MREREIAEKIYKIIEEEIKKELDWICEEGIPQEDFEKCARQTKDVIRRRINQLLNRHEAILVYQP